MKYRTGMPIYNAMDWVLCMCVVCGTLNYVGSQNRGMKTARRLREVWSIV
jgi:hypothetical protein